MPLTTGFARESLLADRWMAGFARNVLGNLTDGTADGSADDALTWPEYVVTNADPNATGAGTLKDALSVEQRWITFSVDIDAQISPTISKTTHNRWVLDGRGRNIRFRIDSSTCFYLERCTNWAMVNVRFDLQVGASGSADGITNEAPGVCWFHHVGGYGIGPDDGGSTGDGMIDTGGVAGPTARPDRVGFSYCRFEDHGKLMLAVWETVNGELPLPSSDAARPKYTVYKTVFRNNRQRQMLFRSCLADLVNCWWDGWGNTAGTSGQALESQEAAYVRPRGCIWDEGTNGRGNASRTTGSQTADGWLRDGGGNLLTGGAVLSTRDTTPFFDPATYYTITPDAAGQALRDDLNSNAGATLSSPPAGGGADVYVVVDNPASPTATDAAVRARLENTYGRTVEYRAASASTPTGELPVVIAESSLSVDLAATYRNYVGPVLTLDGFVADDMDLSSGPNAVLDDTAVILDDTHPLAAGLTGNVVVASAAVNWAEGVAPFGVDVIKVAARTGAAGGESILYAYDAGGQALNGLVVAARRVVYPVHDSSWANLDADGLALFDAGWEWVIAAATSPIGNAAGSYTFTAAAAGVVSSSAGASDTLLYTVTYVTTGGFDPDGFDPGGFDTVTTRATASATFTFTGTASGTPTTLGAATGSYTFTGGVARGDEIAVGVNVSGAEFNSAALPGVHDTDYHHTTAQAAWNQIVARLGVGALGRYPFLWERLQPALSGALDAAEVTLMTAAFDAAAAAGVDVVLDVHNYGRYVGTPIGEPGGPTAADLSDLWSRIVGQWGGHQAVAGYGIMNEPHDMPGGVFEPAVTRYTFDATVEGWVAESGAVAADPTEVHDGAGSLRATKTMGAGFDTVRVNDASGLADDISAGGATVAVWALVPSGAAGSGWQARVEVQDASFAWQAGPYTTLTPGTWAQLSYTPPAGLLADCRAVGVQFDASGVNQAQSVYVDTVQQGASPSSSDAWEQVTQAVVDTIRAAETGAAKTVLVPLNGWSSAQVADVSHPGGPWIVDAGPIRYEAHHYFDRDNSGDYPDTYAAEVTDATGRGYTAGGNADALHTRLRAELAVFTTWLADADGFVGEFGWPWDVDSAAWNAAATVWLGDADTAGLWVTQWAAGEWWGAYNLGVYVDAGLATVRPSSAPIEAYAAGTPTSYGSATGTFSFTGGAAGTATTHGAAAGSYTFTGTASDGVVPPTAAAAFAFTGTASGTPTTPGTAAATFTFTGTASDTVTAAGLGSWVQRLGDASSRQTVPYLRPPSESWAVNADGPWVTGRRYPLGGAGEHVTNTWTFETVWPTSGRPAADDFVALVKAAAESADARLLVNIAAPYGGSPIQFVGETHQVAQQFEAGSSTVSLTLTRVDS